MKKFILSICFALIYSTVGMSQDIHFSQFRTTPLLLDPSQAGKFTGDQRAVINYRNQWRSVANPYQTYGFSFDSRLTKKANFLAGGISIYNDKAGDINMGILLLNATLAYHIQLNRQSYFSAGIQGGMLQRSIDPSQLEFDNQYDGTGFNASLNSGEYISNPSFIQPDFSAGISYSYQTGAGNNVISNNGFRGKKVNIGISAQHVSRPNFTFLGANDQKQAFRYIAHFNTSFGINGATVAVQPSGFIAYQQGAYDVVLGAFIRHTLKEKSKYTTYSNGGSVSFGTHYRFGDAFIFTSIIELGSISLGLSYDLNVSGLAVASNGRGGFEMSLKFVNPNPYGSRRSVSKF